MSFQRAKKLLSADWSCIMLLNFVKLNTLLIEKSSYKQYPMPTSLVAVLALWSFKIFTWSKLRWWTLKERFRYVPFYLKMSKIYKINDETVIIKLYFNFYKSSTDWHCWKKKCKNYIQLDQLKKTKRTNSRLKRDIKYYKIDMTKFPTYNK